MIIVALFVVGLALGSFVNALVWRMHEKLELKTKTRSGKKKYALTAADLSMLKGRSMCTSCHHQLAVKDLIPLASWLWLRGKCRYCHAPISMQYPVVELLAAAAFIASYIYWPQPFGPAGVLGFLFWIIFVTAFIALAVYDIYWYILPDKIVFPVIGLAVISLLIDAVVFHGGLHSILLALLAVACTSGLFLVLYIISGGRWIGFGDVKLAIALGLLSRNPANALLLVFLAALLGTVAALPLMAKGKVRPSSQIPFGPFLLAATYIVVLFGSSAVGWYAHLLKIG